MSVAQNLIFFTLSVFVLCFMTTAKEDDTSEILNEGLADSLEGRFDPTFPKSFQIMNNSALRTTINLPFKDKDNSPNGRLHSVVTDKPAKRGPPFISVNKTKVPLTPFETSSHQPLPQGNILFSPSLSESSTMILITQPLRHLILRSFEGYRRLIRDAHRIEDYIRQSMGLSKRMRLTSLDPLQLPDPVVLEHRDKNAPVLGRMVFTLSDITVAGLSNFRVEQLESRDLGRNLYFQHLIPHMDSVANYSVDYFLFDAVQIRVSSGHLTARVPNARIRGSFQIFPDVFNLWFRVAQVNLTTWVEDLDLKFYPTFLISDKFSIDSKTVDKIHSAFNYFLPNVTDLLRLTYSKAIEMKLT